MSDELKLRRDLETGDRARALLENPTLTGIFDALEAEYIGYWRQSTAINDIAGRERIWQAVQIVGQVRKHLDTIAADGRVAKAALDAMAQGSTR